MTNINLRQNLLTYIAYCLPSDKRFSYEKCQKDLESAGIESTIPTLRKEFSLVKTKGLIEFKTHYRRKYPALSSKGRLEIKTHLPFRRYDWDESWKIVIFDLPENLRGKRIKFQQELIDLGFRKLARGVYLSPHPLFSAVKRLALRLHIEDYLTFIRTKTIEEEKKKIYRAWNLQELNGLYEKFILKAKVVSFDRKPFWPIYAKRLEKEFAKIYEKDPFMPEEFLPANWRGQEAYGIFKAISNSY